MLEGSTELVVIVEGHSEFEAITVLAAFVDTDPPRCDPETEAPLTTVVLIREERGLGRVLVSIFDQDDESTLESGTSGPKEAEISGVVTELVTDITRVTVSRKMLPIVCDEEDADVSGAVLLREVQETK